MICLQCVLVCFFFFFSFFFPSCSCNTTFVIFDTRMRRALVFGFQCFWISTVNNLTRINRGRNHNFITRLQSLLNLASLLTSLPTIAELIFVGSIGLSVCLLYGSDTMQCRTKIMQLCYQSILILLEESCEFISSQNFFL